MTIRSNRSMNVDLSIGAVEGKIRFLRPGAGSADEAPARDRSADLDPIYYGSMGISYNDAYTIHENRPDGPTAPYPPYLGE